MIDTKAPFEDARTHTAWQERSVTDDLLRRVYDLARLGPTSFNCCPMRVVFVKSAKAKARLKPCLNEGNVDKTMKAPATAIVSYDTLLRIVNMNDIRRRSASPGPPQLDVICHTRTLGRPRSRWHSGS